MGNPFEVLYEEIQSLKQLVQELKNQSTTPAPDPDQWFDLNELCAYLPDKPAKPTVYEWVGKRLIPHHKKGKNLYFLKSEIDEWLREGRRKTSKEISQEADKFIKRKKAA